jgi:phage tail-like protein
MAPTKRDTHLRYPYPAYNFKLFVNGIADDGSSVAAAFSEVSGLQVETKVIEYRDGADLPFMHKGRGLTTFTNLVFKRGVTGHVEFWQWMLAGLNGDVDRRNGAVLLLNEDQEEVMRWTFSDAFPAKYSGPGFNAKNSEIAIETFELCHERLLIDLG